MADLVPGNIIQTPDFGQMARGYIQQSRQEEAAKNQYMDQFEKKQGLYLEGDKPAVQEAWNKVQATMDMVAENDSPEMRRKLKEAYGEYGQIAGAAQVLANQYREEVSAYKADPTKFAITGQEFLNSSEDFKLQRRSSKDIFSAIDNPFSIPRSMKYDLLNPVDQAKQMLSDSRMKLPDFYNEEGQLNKAALRAYAEKRARAQVNALPENIEKASAWGGIKEGYAGGQDGRINTPQELEFIRSLDEDTRAGFVEAYINELVNDYISLVPSNLKEKGDKNKLKSLSSFTDVVVAGEVTESGQEVPGTEISAQLLSLPSKIDNITAIGRGSDGNIYVRETVKEKVKKMDPQNPAKEITVDEVSKSIRRATNEEVSSILTKYQNTYDLSSLFENSLPLQDATGFDPNSYKKQNQ